MTFQTIQVPLTLDGNPLAFNAFALERSLRVVHGHDLDAILVPKPFAESGRCFALEPLDALPWRTPWERLLAELGSDGRLNPDVLGTDVPIAEELAATATLDGWTQARSLARRWVKRLMRIVSDGHSVHSTHTIVAHLALAWVAHHEGKPNEAALALCVARFAAELPSSSGGRGPAAFVRAAKLFTTSPQKDRSPC